MNALSNNFINCSKLLYYNVFGANKNIRKQYDDYYNWMIGLNLLFTKQDDVPVYCTFYMSVNERSFTNTQSLKG